MAVALEVVTQDERQVARPLHVLVPLIKKDLEWGAEAGLEHFRAAGEKLLEAKDQIKHGEFKAWVTRNLGVSYSHAHKYMQLAEAAGGQKSFAKDFSSLSDFIRKTSSPNYNKPHTVRPQAWHDPIKEALGRIDTATLNLRKDVMDRAEEHKAQHKLALQLIDIGYKVLATKLHPDKGGSRDAMVRLNQVRDRLKKHA